jgi:hypothetical protein
MKRILSIITIVFFCHMVAVAQIYETNRYDLLCVTNAQPIIQLPPQPGYDVTVLIPKGNFPSGHFTAPANGILVGVMIIAATVFGGACVVIYMCKYQVGDEYTPHVYVLETSQDNVHWTPIATNIMIAPAGERPTRGAFADARNLRFDAFYKVRDDGPYNP